ncbi:hypothetical protein K1719_034137 [Acacia pycnantha]|nr:hypothetical protein K1719_034137 [Acacia pycnantha]
MLDGMVPNLYQPFLLELIPAIVVHKSSFAVEVCLEEEKKVAKVKMFTCIACTKQLAEEREIEGGARESGTPSAKEAVKSLTTQIKDMALKFSGGASSSSTPAWDFIGTHYPAGRSDQRFVGDQTPRGRKSASVCDVVLEKEDEPKEWMAQVEPGVHITFVSLPNGGNDLKRIRFSREMFDKWQAQRWWGENYDRIMELYNVQRFNRQINTPTRSEDEQRDSSYSRLGSARDSPMCSSLNKEWTQRNYPKTPGNRGHHPYELSDQGGGSHFQGGSSFEASRTTTSSRDEPSISNGSDMEAEWVEQDEPGVYITIRQLTDGTRELRRVRFSRERFGEVHAKNWWEENRERIQAQYL